MSEQQFVTSQALGDAQHQLLTLARMQSTLRHRRIEHLSFLEASTIEFPPVASVTLAFPAIQTQRIEVKNSPRHRRLAQLEKYIQHHGVKVPRDEATRIIFASPPTNRIPFHRTLRGELYSTLEHKPSRAESIQASKSDRQKNNLEVASGKIMQQSQEFREFKAKLLEDIGVRAKADVRYSSLEMGSHQEHTALHQSQKMQAKPKKEHKNRLRIKHIHLSPQRYSPWRSEELEEELVL